jgi:hypothetical protein
MRRELATAVDMTIGLYGRAGDTEAGKGTERLRKSFRGWALGVELPCILQRALTSYILLPRYSRSRWTAQACMAAM